MTSELRVIQNERGHYVIEGDTTDVDGRIKLFLSTYYCCEKAIGTGLAICPDCMNANPMPPSFHNGQPEPKEAIRIVAKSWNEANNAFRVMQRHGSFMKTFHFIFVAAQMRNVEGGRVFLLDGWSDLFDAPQIETIAKQKGIQLVNYEL